MTVEKNNQTTPQTKISQQIVNKYWDMFFLKRNSKFSYKKTSIPSTKNSINHRPSQCFKNHEISWPVGGPPPSRYVAVMEVNGRRPPRPWRFRHFDILWGWVGLSFHIPGLLMAREGEGDQGFFGAEKKVETYPQKIETQNDDWICLSIFSVLLPYGFNTYILDIHYIGDK